MTFYSSKAISRVGMLHGMLCFLGIVLLSEPLSAQKKTFHCRKTEQVIDFIQQNHYSPKYIDSNFTKEVNTSFITLLDPLGIFFTKDKATHLLSLCPDLSNMECSNNKNFMEHIAGDYRFCLFESEEYMNRIMLNPIDFNASDTLILPEGARASFPKDVTGLEQNWNKYLKFQILRYYFSTYLSDDIGFIKNESNFLDHQDTLRKEIMQREYCKINHLLDYPGGFEDYIFGMYLNTLTGSFDPHTNYFSMNDKALFESSISKNKISFGADLEQNENGEIAISRLIPGGPAWRSGEVNSGDVLLSLQFPDREAVDLVCSDLSEIQDLIYNSGSDRIEITIRSQLGQVKIINLKMEVLSAAENSVYSFILDGDKKIGYISLPGFYTEPDKLDPLGCANDLAKEIQKMESDSIAGLILDVRNNGGGSIVEAVDLAGIFIDSGPLCIYKTSDEKPELIKDLKRGSLYKGPLLLLVNGYSASASEILAGILQDYNRAVVVGTPTFGKASGQIVVPLSEPGDGSPGYFSYDAEPTDFVKITTTRYYRLNGSSHQSVGITPDIPLPAHVGYSKIKESSLPSALQNDTIRKNITFSPFPQLPIPMLRVASGQRIASNQNFQKFLALNDSIKPLYTNEIRIPIDFDTFRRDYFRNKGFFNQIDSLKTQPGTQYTIEDNLQNRDLLTSDTYKHEIHKEIIRNLSKDFYLEEAFLIITDLIGIANENKAAY